MNKKIFNNLLSAILIITIVFSLNYSLANEAVNNANNTATNDNSNEAPNDNTNATNESENKVLTLKEQKKQVEEAINEASGKLSYVSGEISSTLVKIQGLNDQISEYETSSQEIIARYTDLQNQITQNEQRLNITRKNYEDKLKLLKDRLVEFYKKGDITYIDVLLDSNNIIEFVSNYFIMSEIVEYDSKGLQELKDQEKEIEEIEADLGSKKEELKDVKEKAYAQTVLLTNSRIKVENYKLSLSESEKELNAQIDTYKKQQEEIANLIANAIYASSYELVYSGGIMQWPTLTSNYITSPFGSRLHPIQGVTKNHDGIDIGGSTGQPIYAAQDGVIIYSGWLGGYGKATMIDHGMNENGVKVVTLYGHGSELLKNLGDVVMKGDVIMEMGSTGNSTGPHVHFEVRENNVAVDPKKYLSASYVDETAGFDENNVINQIINNSTNNTN